MIDQAKLDAGTAALTQRMQEAIALGYVPTIAAATKVAEAVTVAAVATEKASDSIAASLFRLGAASAETIATLDALIAKGQAAQAAMAGGGGGGGGAGGGARGGATIAAGGGAGRRATIRSTSRRSGGSSGRRRARGSRRSRPATCRRARATILAARRSAAKRPGASSRRRARRPAPIVSPWRNVPSFQLGGAARLRPGADHCAWRRARRARRRRRRPRHATVHVTVNQTGTVISQDRDWRTLVETIRAEIVGRVLDARAPARLLCRQRARGCRGDAHARRRDRRQRGRAAASIGISGSSAKTPARPGSARGTLIAGSTRPPSPCTRGSWPGAAIAGVPLTLASSDDDAAWSDPRHGDAGGRRAGARAAHAVRRARAISA